MAESQVQSIGGEGKERIRLAKGLPLLCAARLEGTGDSILILKGEPGYVPFPEVTDVDAWNRSRGITPAQAEAMQVGSMFGWDVPGATPRNWEHLNS